MTFGWEGFSFDHPDEWLPTVLSGRRSEGYVRIASAGRLMLQVRWRQAKKPADATAFLDAYLGRLGQDAKKAKQSFDSERQTEGERVHYRYTGSVYGRGTMFYDANDGRSFVFEVVSSKNDSSLTILREATRSFRAGEVRDRWSVLGLDLSLPKGLEVEKQEFLSGKTRLNWRAKPGKLLAERWGLADQLLSRHGQAEWAAAILGVEPRKLQEDADGLRASIPGPFWRGRTEALVVHQADRNQLIVLRSESKNPDWRPTCDWLN